MEPFNIRIAISNRPLTLTILPAADYYKVVFFGGIVGAITIKNKQWLLVPPELVETGDLPPYHHTFEESFEELQLNQQNIQKIGEEIEKIALQ